MCVAPAAQHLCPFDEHACIAARPDIFLGRRRPETRPPCLRIELLLGPAKRVIATNASEQTGFVKLVIRTGERRIGSFFARDVKLLRAEKLAPFFSRSRDFPDACRPQSLAGIIKRN